MLTLSVRVPLEPSIGGIKCMLLFPGNGHSIDWNDPVFPRSRTTAILVVTRLLLTAFSFSFFSPFQTFTGNILVSVNPYKMFDIYGVDMVKKYENQIIGTLAP